ncbi:MAG TPA: hypothetical protein ENK18_15070 [Deltaproteobacteria bacterium]|nr:hypothetical protein [Deltaproteobacteria bacterium]
MARTHDGIQTPLPPNVSSLMLGVLVLAGGVATAIFAPSPVAAGCAGAPITLIGLLMLLNQVSGKRRVRITNSKLLVEDERLVMGFLIGPSKDRVTWPDLQGVELAEGVLIVRGREGHELRLGEGCPPEELAELKERIGRAVEAFDPEL